MRIKGCVNCGIPVTNSLEVSKSEHIRFMEFEDDEDYYICEECYLEQLENEEDEDYI
ncbi:hypothetical protein D3C81_869210 [compost metagenome]